MFVHVVRQHPHMRVTHQHVGELFQLALRVGRARRVRGRVENEPLGARIDCALEVRRLQLEPVLDRGRHNDRRASVDRHHLRIAHPIGRGDDDLVALVHTDQEGVVEDLFSPGGDDRVGGLVVEAVLTAELGRDRLAQGRDAEHGRVLGLAALDRLDRRLLDVVGRVEIRLADRKRDHLPPFGFEVARLLRHRDGRGWLNAREDVGEEGHGLAPFGCGGVLSGAPIVRRAPRGNPARRFGRREDAGCHPRESGGPRSSSSGPRLDPRVRGDDKERRAEDALRPARLPPISPSGDL